MIALKTSFFARFFLSAFVLGVLSALSTAPILFVPALFVGLSGLYVLLGHVNTARGAFVVGWAFAFGYFLCGLSWVANALLVEDNPYRWAYPLAVCGLPFILAPFCAFGCAAIKVFLPLKTVRGFLGAVVILGAAAWLRGHMFTGFPWNLYGYAWAGVSPMSQGAAIIGIYGLTTLTIFWAMAAGFVWLSRADKRRCMIIGGVAILSFLALYLYGDQRIKNNAPRFYKNIRVHIGAPYIPQHEKWLAAKADENFAKYIQSGYPAAQAQNFDGVTYIVWPETALTSWYLERGDAMADIQTMLAAYDNTRGGHAVLMTGMLRYDAAQDTHYNALVMITRDGAVRNVYDKHHLVPFGEYIPFGRYIPIPAINSFSAFGAGAGPKIMTTPQGLSYSPLVCYEAIFPRASAPQATKIKPDFLINVTNDAWYYDTRGPAQHAVHARFRAIEQGVPLIRAANGGISGVIDPLGHYGASNTGVYNLPKALP